MNPACSTPVVAFGKGGAPEIPHDPPVVSLLTAPGRSALAVVGICGRASVEILSRSFRPKGRPLADREDGAVVFGQWGSRVDEAMATTGGMPPEDLVVVMRSKTILEIHPHGGLAASSRVLGDLEAAGCRRLPWPEWLAATSCSEIEVEARVALAQASGPKAATIICRQLSPPATHSGLCRQLSPPATHSGESLRGGGGLPGLLETEIDAIRGLAAEGRLVDAGRHADVLLAWAPLGLRLTRPWRVVVKGRPNAGKSSLVNALAGFARSLVSSEPGTTRDVLETRIVLDGWEIDLIDTAGLRDDPASPTERAGIDRARGAALSADLVLEVLDASDFSDVESGGKDPGKPFPPLVILAKVDLLPASGLAEPSSEAALAVDAIRTSAITGEGIDTLAAVIIRRLVPREPGQFDAVPFTPRQVAFLRSIASRG